MLDDIKKALWSTADKLRANMDAAEYKHLVLGLIFVKYISDTFAARRSELERRFNDPSDEINATLAPNCLTANSVNLLTWCLPLVLVKMPAMRVMY